MHFGPLAARALLELWCERSLRPRRQLSMASLFKKASTSEAPPPPPPEAVGKVVSGPEKLIQDRIAEWREATAVAEDGMGMVTGVTKKMYMKAISKRMDSGELTRGGNNVDEIGWECDARQAPPGHGTTSSFPTDRKHSLPVFVPSHHTVAIVFAYGTRLVDSEGTGPGTAGPPNVPTHHAANT